MRLCLPPPSPAHLHHVHILLLKVFRWFHICLPLTIFIWQWPASPRPPTSAPGCRGWGGHICWWRGGQKVRGTDTRHCWPRVNTGHRDRELRCGMVPLHSLQTPGCSCWYRNMSGYTVLILVLFLRWCYNLFVWMDWNWYRLFIYLFLQFVCGGVVVSSTYYSLQLQFTWNANQSRSLFQMWFS